MYDMKKSEVSFNVVYGGNLPGDVGKFIPAILWVATGKNGWNAKLFYTAFVQHRPFTVGMAHR